MRLLMNGGRFFSLGPIVSWVSSVISVISVVHDLFVTPIQRGQG